jgi:hypothetical protein
MFELWDKNSPHALLEWMRKALAESDITEEERENLTKVGAQCIADGGWRGDICNRWRNLGFGSAKIEDFYP